jgi:hypothetical protein
MQGELIGGPGDPLRPHQHGAAQGQAPDGSNANESKNWLIDTGAQISCISEANARNFKTTPTGGTAGGVEHGGGLVIVSGVTMVFNVATDDPAYPGGGRNVSCSLPVAITPASDIIGMDQLANQHVHVEWSPATSTGRLIEVTGPRRRGG